MSMLELLLLDEEINDQDPGNDVEMMKQKVNSLYDAEMKGSIKVMIITCMEHFLGMECE